MNSGKKFENQFKKSVPKYCLYHRLVDAPQSFNRADNSDNGLRFSWKNPCDCFIFDSLSHYFYTLELKSTKSTSMSFEDINSEEKQSKMIHKHQIEALIDFDKFDGVISGFIYNFRDEDKNEEKTYFQYIADFTQMTSAIGKKSFNIKDLKNYNAIEISGKCARTNYTWDIEGFLQKINSESRKDK